jgi:hypothetical protein
LDKENPAEAKAREIAEAFLAKRFTDNGEALEDLTGRVKVALEQAEPAGVRRLSGVETGQKAGGGLNSTRRSKTLRLARLVVG